MKKSKAKNRSQNKKRSSAKLGNVFDKHVKFEFEDKDVESTMKTMVKEPYVHHVPTMTGGLGYDKVYNFYKNDFVGKMLKDVKIKRISRTIGKNRVVDELILSFTHDLEIKSMLPGIQPTGKYVELPHIVVMKFRGNKIAHEHIYWDQASLLTQVGILAPRNLPITGIKQAQKLIELSTRQLRN
jgi:carboxymethylenebutenolidase